MRLGIETRRLLMCEVRCSEKIFLKNFHIVHEHKTIHRNNRMEIQSKTRDD